MTFVACTTDTGTDILSGHEPATFAVVLYLDEDTEHRIREIWAALDVHGVASVAQRHGPAYRPHLTLAVVETTHAAGLAEALRGPLAGVAGLPVTLASLGFFLTEAAPAYLAVTPTSRLLRLHEDVHVMLGSAGSWGYYRPGTWVPHCTLAMEVTSTEGVAEVVRAARLPIGARVSVAHVVRLPQGRDGAIPAQRDREETAAEARHRAGPRHRGGRRIPPSFVRW